MPRRPKLPKIGLPSSPVQPLREALSESHKRIQEVRDDIRSVADDLHGFSILGRITTTTAPTAQDKAPPAEDLTTVTKQPQDVATACVPCALGHFSTSAGLLNEIVRFKGEGITSNEILDRVAKVLEEQNALERVDLTEENLQSAPPWEREIAEEALSQSRKLRHTLESFTSIKQLEKAAADTGRFYKDLNRKWFKRRFAHLGPEKAERIAEEVSKQAGGEYPTYEQVSESVSRFLEERK